MSNQIEVISDILEVPLRIAKTAYFGMAYGMGTEGVSKALGVPPEHLHGDIHSKTAEEIHIEKYNKSFSHMWSGSSSKK